MGEREAGGTCALIKSLGVTACSCFFASEEKLRENVHYYMYYCSNRRLLSRVQELVRAQWPFVTVCSCSTEESCTERRLMYDSDPVYFPYLGVDHWG